MQTTPPTLRGLIFVFALLGLAGCAADDYMDDNASADAAVPATGLQGPDGGQVQYSSDALRAGTDSTAPPEPGGLVAAPAATGIHQVTIDNRAKSAVTDAEIVVPNTTMGTGNVLSKSPIASGSSFTVTLPANAPCFMNVHVGFASGEKRDFQGLNSCDKSAGTLTLADAPAARPLVNGHEPTAAPVPLSSPPAASRTASTAGHGTMIQLGAYPDIGDAKAAWQSMFKAHADLLSDDTPSYSNFTGTGSQWVRLRIGPFASASAAADLCNKIHAAHLECFLAR